MIRFGALSAFLGVAVVVSGCPKKEEAPAPAPAPLPPPPPAAEHPAAAAEAAGDAAVVRSGIATVHGTVKLVGKPPEMKMTNRASDPFCARTAVKDEEVLVGPGGALKNVLVRITEGISGNYEAPMTNATLDQSACMYRPRVQALFAGQSLLIRNSDQTLHNVHAYKGASTMFNQAEIPGLPPMAKKFNESGTIIKFKCDVHPWMTGYVAIVNNPFFAVTGDDGAFAIPKIPAGTYTIEAWHERYGTKKVEIAIEAGTPEEVQFQYDSK